MPQMEVVMNAPLNGSEVREIILDAIKRALDGDTRLHEMMAFPSFRFTADIAIVLTGAVHSDINRTVEGGRGDIAADPTLPATHVLAHVEQSEMPPNQARVDAGIGVPVLGRDERGRQVEKRVKYAREHATSDTDTGADTVAGAVEPGDTIPGTGVPGSGSGGE